MRVLISALDRLITARRIVSLGRWTHFRCARRFSRRFQLRRGLGETIMERAGRRVRAGRAWPRSVGKRHFCDIRKLAVMAVVIEPVPDDEMVFDDESHEIRLKRDHAPRRLVQQGACANGLCALRQ